MVFKLVKRNKTIQIFSPVARTMYQAAQILKVAKIGTSASLHYDLAEHVTKQIPVLNEINGSKVQEYIIKLATQSNLAAKDISPENVVAASKSTIYTMDSEAGQIVDHQIRIVNSLPWGKIKAPTINDVPFPASLDGKEAFDAIQSIGIAGSKLPDGKFTSLNLPEWGNHTTTFFHEFTNTHADRLYELGTFSSICPKLGVLLISHKAIVGMGGTVGFSMMCIMIGESNFGQLCQNKIQSFSVPCPHIITRCTMYVTKNYGQIIVRTTMLFGSAYAISKTFPMVSSGAGSFASRMFKSLGWIKK